MTNSVISVEHLTKQYDLGVIGTGTISRDLNRWWARVRNEPDPYTRIGQRDAFERIGESILALDDVSFQVQQGEALGIIGRNGAGKSTLLKILSRITAPSSGLVKVKGRIGSLLEIGTGFHPELTGRENIYLNGAILGMKKAEVTRKFDEIVSFAGVEKFIDTPVKRYSSGMYVRLAFAVAAHLDPEILIVDEVLAVGDAEFQKKCLGKMGDVANEGRTVLFVSHNMASIQQLCGRCVLLANGQFAFNGTPDETINYYLTNLKTSSDIESGFELTPTVVFKRMYLIQNGLLCNEIANTGLPITVHIEFEILEPTKDLLIGFEIFTSQGTLLCRTYDTEIFGIGYRPVGSFHDVYEFPENTFQPTTFYFSLIYAIHHETPLNRQKVVIPINMIEARKSDIDLPGIIKPTGYWKNVI